MDRFSDHGISVDESRGGEVDTTCPQCSASRKKNNHKCLSVNVPDGTWHCHHCGWSGCLKGRQRDPFGYRIQEKKYVLPQYTPEAAGALLPEKVIEWFRKRGISEETLARENIGYDKGWIKFPYYRDGVVVNIKSRKLESKEFFQEKEAERILYGMVPRQQVGEGVPESMEGEDETLIWVEGELDRLALVEAGFRYVVSVPDGAPAKPIADASGKMGYLRNCESYISLFSRHIIFTDNDAPGTVLRDELARRLGIERCLRVSLPEGCKDANDVLMKLGDAALRSVVKGARYFPVDGIYEVRDILPDAAKLYDDGITRGVSTGWHSLDKYLTCRRGELHICTGIPASGKSSLIDHLMIHLASNEEWICGIYSPENSPLSQHFKRLAECYVGKSFLPGDYERMTSTEMITAARFLQDHFYFISSSDSTLTTSQILEKARVLVYRHGIDFLVIDPFNDVDLSDMPGDSETIRISMMLSKLQRFARIHNVLVVLVAHPTKLKKNELTGEYPCPTPYDIAGSSAFRNRADVCYAAHRPDLTKDFIELHIQKVRHREIGKPGMIRLDYSRSCGRFHEHIGFYGTPKKEREQIKRRIRDEVAAELAPAYCQPEEQDGE